MRPNRFWFSLVRFGSVLTVVVLTRPPGCVQVQPDWFTRRLQPSSSKHGDISHHCRLHTIRTEGEEEEERQVSCFVFISFLFYSTGGEDVFVLSFKFACLFFSHVAMTPLHDQAVPVFSDVFTRNLRYIYLLIQALLKVCQQTNS